MMVRIKGSNRGRRRMDTDTDGTVDMPMRWRDGGDSLVR